MPTRDHSDTDEGDGPQDDPTAGAGETPIIFEFTVPAADFVLGEALGDTPDVLVEAERFIPTNDEPLPFLWVTDGATSEFETRVRDDSTVDRLVRTVQLQTGALYRLEWDYDDGEGDGDLLEWFATASHDSTALQATGCEGTWTLKLRFPSRGDLDALQTFLGDHDVGYDVVRLYDLDDPKLGQYNATRKQREALLAALEQGYFAIPREATLQDVAAALDISAKSASERIRRGQTNLITNTLTIGRQTGIGLPSP